MEPIAPAGNAPCCVSDLARYAGAHLDGLAGEDGILRAETFLRLHTPSGVDGMHYAGGWFVTRGPGGEPLHSHGGTIGASFAEVRLYPESRTGVGFLTTVSRGPGESISQQIARAVLERFRPQESGFTGREGGSQPLIMVEETPSPGNDERCWRVIEKLSQAINNEDRPAYHALFADGFSAANRDSMFEFMAAQVLPSRGGILAFHELTPSLLVSDARHTVRLVSFHLENGFPGYYGVTLDEADKLFELSIFVKGDLCPNGTDRRCASIVKSLDAGL